MSPAAGSQMRWQQELRKRASDETGAILYFPVFGPPARRSFSPPPDFSDLSDLERQARGERRAWRGLAMSIFLHLVLLVVGASAWSNEGLDKRPPRIQDGLSVALVDDVPGTPKPSSGRSPVAGVGEQPGFASAKDGLVASDTALIATNDPVSAPVPPLTEASSPSATPPPSDTAPSAEMAKLPDASAALSDRGDVGGRIGSPEEGRWEGAILSRLAHKKRYPPEALKAALGDTIMLRLTIDRDGRLLLAEIAKSRGVAMLDKEALALAWRASPYPAPPDTVVGDAVRLVVPIEFIMKRAR
jgi:TonB family protein